MPLYFRQFPEDRDDPGLEALSDAQFRIYWRLYCFASEQIERGIIRDVPPGLLAVAVARGSAANLTKTLPVLVARGLITLLPGADDAAPATLVITNWDERQHVPPSALPHNTRARKRAQRQRDRAAVTPARDQVTDPRDTVTPTRDSVTDPRDVTRDRVVTVTDPRDVTRDRVVTVTNSRDIGLPAPGVTRRRDTNGYHPGGVTETRDNVTETRDISGTPYITRAGDAPTRVRAEYTLHSVDGDEPEDLAASTSLPASPSPQRENRARALDHPTTATGADALYTGPPVTETGLTWWTHYLAVEGVDAPPAWTTIAWLQAQQEAMACKAQLDQRRIRNWALEMQRWLRNELQIRVRDGTVHKAEPAPGPARPANIPPPATGAGLIPPALSDSPDAAAARARLADEQLRAWVLNLGRQLHDPAGVAAAQAALLAYLAAHPTLHVLSVKAQLVGLVEATSPQTLAELWGFARIPLAPPTAPGDEEKEVQPDAPATLAAAPLRP